MSHEKPIGAIKSSSTAACALRLSRHKRTRTVPQVGPPPYDERYERNALDIFSDGLDNLFRDPFGWLFNVPSAMHSTMDRAFGGVERMPQPSNSALSSSAREARRRWMDGPTLGS